MTFSRTTSWSTVFMIVGLGVRRWSGSASWFLLLPVAGLITLPLALSPHLTLFLPAMLCGAVAAESDFMDMFGARERDYARFAVLPIGGRDLILGKGILAMTKATIGAMSIAALHLWFAPARPALTHIAPDLLGFIATLPLLAQVGASTSLQALRSPTAGLSDPIVRVSMLLLAGIVCGIPAAALRLISGSWLVLLFYATGVFLVWVMLGAQATGRSLERWNHSPGYNV